MAAKVVNGNTTFSKSQQLQSDMNGLNGTSSMDESHQMAARGDASDSTDYTMLSETERSKQLLADKWNAAYKSSSAPAGTIQVGTLPHETSSKDSGAPFFMSWWPMPDDLVIVGEDCSSDANRAKPIATRPRATQRQPSIFQKLETRLADFVHTHHIHKPAASSPGGDINTDTRSNTTSTSPAAPKSSKESDNLYHVVLTTSHSKKDVNSQIQSVRICGSFDSLSAAKALAHRCLFSAGYEREWFSTFKTQHDLHLIDHTDSKIVEATGPAGELFTVDIATVPNLFGLKSGNPAKRITTPLYHVVQTIVHYSEDESGQSRETTIQGSFPEYLRARQVAHELLLWFEDGIDRDTYVQYEEAGVGEQDCGYGENVIVHAVGEDGSNYLVSILKGEEMEAERVRDAARAMRA